MLARHEYNLILSVGSSFRESLGGRRMHPIAFYRRARGWRQSDLAEKLGVSTNSVQAWERGTAPRPATFLKLAEVLGVDSLRLARESQKWKQGSKGR